MRLGILLGIAMLESIPPAGDRRVVKDRRHLHRLLRPGVALRVFSNRALSGPRLHVRSVVDGTVVVYRVWKRGRWYYGSVSVSDLERHVALGQLSVADYCAAAPDLTLSRS